MKFTVCVFKCKWVDNTAVRTDDIGFTLVDLKKLGYHNDPFIMAEQARQVFYVQDPCDERWCVVLQGKTVGVNVEDDDSYMDTYVSPLTAQITGNVVREEVDDVHANCKDHDEGELINIVYCNFFYYVLHFSPFNYITQYSFVIILKINVFFFTGKWLHNPALLLLLLMQYHIPLLP